MKKRGIKAQITLFIIIGIVLLIGVGSLYYVLSGARPVTDVETKIKDISIHDEASIKDYVESCMLKDIRENVMELSMKGGSYDADFMHDGKVHSTFAKVSMDVYKPLNVMLTKEELAEQLRKRLLPLIRKCVDITVFKKEGYEFTQGGMNLEIVVATDDVSMKLTYPVSLTKGSNVIQIDTYNAKFRSSLGKLHDIAVLITNEELLNNYFDKDSFMLKHNYVMIHKDKPYPHITYTLVENDYEFNFVLEGESTVDKLGSARSEEHTSELQSHSFISYAVFCLKKK